MYPDVKHKLTILVIGSDRNCFKRVGGNGSSFSTSPCDKGWENLGKYNHFVRNQLIIYPIVFFQIFLWFWVILISLALSLFMFWNESFIIVYFSLKYYMFFSWLRSHSLISTFSTFSQIYAWTSLHQLDSHYAKVFCL